jgi:cytoskeletal protein RodZ
MDWDDGYGFPSVLERVLYIGFSAVLSLVLLAVLALLIRFLWVGTKAAQIYVRTHEPPRPPRSTEYVQNTPRGPVPAGSPPPSSAQTAPTPAGGGPGSPGRTAGSAPRSASNVAPTARTVPLTEPSATAQTVPLTDSAATAPTVPLTDSAATAPTVPLTDSAVGGAQAPSDGASGSTGSAAHPVGRTTPRKPRLPKSPS